MFLLYIFFSSGSAQAARGWEGHFAQASEQWDGSQYCGSQGENSLNVKTVYDGATQWVNMAVMLCRREQARVTSASTSNLWSREDPPKWWDWHFSHSAFTPRNILFCVCFLKKQDKKCRRVFTAFRAVSWQLEIGCSVWTVTAWSDSAKTGSWIW